MKLLIITQKVNRQDAVLGFFHRWVEEFAKHAEQVTVICLEKGEYELPENVRVLSLGKEIQASRFTYLKNFYNYIYTERKNYDAVFVHMNPIYSILGGVLWKFWGKKTALWYTHKHVDMKLRVATLLSNVVFSAARETFRLPTQKLQVMGHGIDIDQFTCAIPKANASVIRIVCVGRISEIKGCHILIEAAALLQKSQDLKFTVEFVGAPITEVDKAYAEKLHARVAELGLQEIVVFSGSIANKDIQQVYCQADISINASITGGIDKTVLESMAAGVPVVVYNIVFSEYFGPYTSKLLVTDTSSESLARKIANLMHTPQQERESMASYLHQVAQERASITALIPRIIQALKKLI
jgi:glycosyltransferase involved in cell wall biosynthesis